MPPLLGNILFGFEHHVGSRLILYILAGAVTVIVITWLRDRVRAKRGGV